MDFPFWIIVMYLTAGLLYFLKTVRNDIKNGYFYKQGTNKPFKFISSMLIISVFWLVLFNEEMNRKG